MADSTPPEHQSDFFDTHYRDLMGFLHADPTARQNQATRYLLWLDKEKGHEAIRQAVTGSEKEAKAFVRKTLNDFFKSEGKTLPPPISKMGQEIDSMGHRASVKKGLSIAGMVASTIALAPTTYISATHAVDRPPSDALVLTDGGYATVQEMPVRKRDLPTALGFGSAALASLTLCLMSIMSVGKQKQLQLAARDGELLAEMDALINQYDEERRQASTVGRSL